jgi:nanoRNase/pAp phosphatase (c-di-AMP/oligoRNAs hydrolase)
MQEILERLFGAIGGTASVLILPHNSPDPDAIASAVALRHLLAERLGVESEIAYTGIIGRAENRALVHSLGRPLRPLTDSDLSRPVPIALVDTQPGTGNIALPPQSSLAIVIDHHIWREETATASFADVRPELGATSTILAEYLTVTGVEPPAALATALFYGIKTNTMALGRDASPADATAYFHLQSQVDVQALVRIEQAQVPADYFRSFDTTLRAARIYNGVVIAYLGLLDYPDLTAEMADHLLRLERAQWVICIGLYEDGLILSVRTRSRRGAAEKLVLAIVGEDGTAGGHGTMAGAQVPLGGKDPEQTVHQLSQRGLHYLGVSSDMAGKPLIEFH